MHLDSMKGQTLVFICEPMNLDQLRHLNLIVKLTDAIKPFVSGYHLL